MECVGAFPKFKLNLKVFYVPLTYLHPTSAIFFVCLTAIDKDVPTVSNPVKIISVLPATLENVAL